jgi:hypothetical protein
MKIEIDIDKLAEAIKQMRTNCFGPNENNEKNCFDLNTLAVADALFLNTSEGHIHQEGLIELILRREFLKQTNYKT